MTDLTTGERGELELLRAVEAARKKKVSAWSKTWRLANKDKCKAIGKAYRMRTKKELDEFRTWKKTQAGA